MFRAVHNGKSVNDAGIAVTAIARDVIQYRAGERTLLLPYDSGVGESPEDALHYSIWFHLPIAWSPPYQNALISNIERETIKICLKEALEALPGGPIEVEFFQTHCEEGQRTA